jgi:hypothetical protein
VNCRNRRSYMIMPILIAIVGPATLHADGGAFPLFAIPDQPAVLAEAGSTAPLADGAGALFSNPAGLSQTGNSELYLSMGWLYEEMSRKTVALVLPVPSPSDLTGRVWFALGVSSIDYGSMERRTAPSSEPLGEYDANDTRGTAALSLRAWRHLHVGAALNYFETRIAEYDASLATVDLGIQYSFSRFGLDVGFSGTNLVTFSQSETVGGDAWVSYQAGIQWSTLGNCLAPALTFRWGDGEDVETLSGIHYVIADKLTLRAGRVFGHYSAGYAAGIGGRVHDLGIDYSFEDYGEGLGAVHRIGLSWKLS